MTPAERAALLAEADALVERGTGREWPVLRDLAAEVRALEAENATMEAALHRIAAGRHQHDLRAIAQTAMMVRQARKTGVRAVVLSPSAYSATLTPKAPPR